MGKKLEVLKGERYGYWAVVKEVEPRKDKKGKNYRMFECQCDCGTVKVIMLQHLKNSGSQSCGCLLRKFNHSNKKLVFGVGINDYDGMVAVNDKIIKSYATWRGMIRRCYSAKQQIKQPTYIGCTVCDDWIYFSRFKAWFDANWNEKYMNNKWQLDKDILCKNNKIYSPETCCFVPQEINLIFVNRKSRRGVFPAGVEKSKKKFEAGLDFNKKHIHIGVFKTVEDAFNAYKTAKEACVKETAEKWKGKIAGNVYNALYAYKVEITD